MWVARQVRRRVGRMVKRDICSGGLSNLRIVRSAIEGAGAGATATNMLWILGVMPWILAQASVDI